MPAVAPSPTSPPDRHEAGPYISTRSGPGFIPGRLTLALLGIPAVAAVLLAGPVEGHKGLPPKKGETGRQEVRGRRPVADFTLKDQEGRPLASRDLRGKAVLVTFGFTTCVDVCPIQTAKGVAVEQALPAALRDRVHMLLITTDPGVDTPAALKEYARKFGADPTRFSFLTGDPAALATVWHDFGVAVKKKGPGNVDHTTLTSLVDPEGNLRVNYYGLGWTPAGVVRDIAIALGVEQADR